MEQDSIPITEGLRLRLEALKHQWQLGTYEQVLERALTSGELATSPQPESLPEGITPEVYAAVERLREATKPLRGKSMRELKQAIHEQAMLEAGG